MATACGTAEQSRAELGTPSSLGAHVTRREPRPAQESGRATPPSEPVPGSPRRRKPQPAGKTCATPRPQLLARARAHTLPRLWSRSSHPAPSQPYARHTKPTRPCGRPTRALRTPRVRRTRGPSSPRFFPPPGRDQGSGCACAPKASSQRQAGWRREARRRRVGAWLRRRASPPRFWRNLWPRTRSQRCFRQCRLIEPGRRGVG